MATYLIANKKTQQLETIVFAGEGGDVVAVFTDPANARKYIEDAGWTEEFTVATLQPIEFLQWLLKCHQNGVESLVTDPKRVEHESGDRLNVLNIKAQLEHAGQHINLVASPDF